MRSLVTIAALLVASGAAAKGKPRIAVLDFEASGVRQETVDALNAVAPSELRRREPNAEVISGADIRTMLRIERQQQLLGCADDGTCLAEISDAPGASKMLGGKLGRVGGNFVLEVSLLDNRNVTGSFSVTRVVPKEEALVEQLKSAIGELLWIASPKEPKVVALSLGMIGLGGVVAAAGATGVVYSLKVNAAYLGQQEPAAVPDPTVSRSDAQLVKTLYPLSWTGIGVGAVMIWFGTWGLLNRQLAPAGLAIAVGPGSITFAGAFWCCACSSS